MNRSPPVICLALLCLLSACQSVPQTSAGDNAAFRERLAELSTLSHWRVVGRIAFRYAGDGGTGAMTWIQQDSHMQFGFRGPLGAASFNVEGSPPSLLLETGSGDREMLTDPDIELRTRFGWSAPFESLRYWMVGIPDPAAPSTLRVSDDGILRELGQGGWRITYDSYHDGQPQLPRKLTLLRDDVRIRVIVDRWQILPAIDASLLSPLPTSMLLLSRS